MATAEAKKPEINPANIDVWATDKSEWEYITMPKKDALGKGYPNVTINGRTFKAGEKYHLPSIVVEEVRNIMDGYDHYTRRLMQNDVDLDALGVVDGTTRH